MMYLFEIFVLICMGSTLSHSWTAYPDPVRGNKAKARWETFKAIPTNERTYVRLSQVCGEFKAPTCRSAVGRPADDEMETCDVYCCYSGYLTGYCDRNAVGIALNTIWKLGSKFGVKAFAEAIGIDPNSAAALTSVLPVSKILPKVSNCKCTNDYTDAFCGRDGSFLGIRCPDKSACARKCCRRGMNNYKCGGFLKTRCKCWN